LFQKGKKKSFAKKGEEKKWSLQEGRREAHAARCIKKKRPHLDPKKNEQVGQVDR